ncbi:flavin-binding monooxygenase-like protein-like protein [Westerdykella ornata]|uniref:Flavin-binding monooxygenase-like protein-like protein n=1 Tax=Westerdykella ornata TaxID=318751 RepID=A0A6A6JNG2_WESOR|nr:flavin-binding monooxygenase-like protein-like protein [Westerdykella ornata]KAF2277765.1 flavin-binding monooxygenase-like protein-like protein [Westerdykella ornata]
MEDEQCDIVVVGAGIYGITAAAVYHRLHPGARLVLLEASQAIGGPWAPHRIFPGLRTNNLWGTYEIPDFPMDEERFGVKKGEHIPADKVHQYLEALVKESDLTSSVRLNTKVQTAEKSGRDWILHCKSISGSGERLYKIHTPKLILSTGLSNRPSMPTFPTAGSFEPLVIHSDSFATHFNDIVKPSTSTLIIGGGKSAWDIAYACATQPNSTATMLIRPSGKGPIWMSPPYVTPLKLWLEKLVFTRFVGLMSPCPWASDSGFEGIARRFLHRTWFGRKIVAAFWNVLGEDVVCLNKYNEHPETKKLRPWRDAFEVGTALSILNYPTNFFDLVRDAKIKVIIGEVQGFEKSTEVRLTTGEALDVNAVVCATGWETNPSIEFIPSSIKETLGLPSAGKPADPKEKALIKQVEEELYNRYPILKQRDSSKKHHPDPAQRQSTRDLGEGSDEQPYRLFRFMVPPSDIQDRSIGFVGAMMTLGTAPCAYIQALWLAAYFDGTLPLPTSKSPSEIKYDTYLETQYCALRHAMGYGNKFPDLVFDSLPYFDVLLRDLGFEGKRKGRFTTEYFGSYGPEDYRGLVDEWQKRITEQKKKAD